MKNEGTILSGLWANYHFIIEHNQAQGSKYIGRIWHANQSTSGAIWSHAGNDLIEIAILGGLKLQSYPGVPSKFEMTWVKL